MNNMKPLELWATDIKGNTIAKFKNQDEVNVWLLNNPTYYQIWCSIYLNKN